MADVLNPQVQDGVVSENFKVGAGAPAFSTNRSQSSAVDFDKLMQAKQLRAEDDANSHQRSVNIIREYMLGSLIGLNPVASVSAQKDLSGNDLSQNGMSQALAAAMAQILSKQGDNTPPQTGTQTPGGSPK